MTSVVNVIGQGHQIRKRYFWAFIYIHRQNDQNLTLSGTNLNSNQNTMMQKKWFNIDREKVSGLKNYLFCPL